MNRGEKILSESDVDAILIYNGFENQDLSFFYFTELVESGIFEGSFAIVTKDWTKVVTSTLEENSASLGNNEVLIYDTRRNEIDILQECLKDAEKIGINHNTLTLRDFEKLKKIIGDKEYIDISEILIKHRMVKDNREIKNIKEACKIVDEVVQEIPDMLKQNMAELELSSKIVHSMMNKGASKPGFDTIVAFGENAAESHHISSQSKLKKGDAVLVDFGALYKKYTSDISRTYFFGKASEKQRDVYQIVKKAQQLGIEKISEGIEGSAVDDVVRKYIFEEGYGYEFVHSTGHGIGLSVHDHGALSQNIKLKLKAGMTITVEPGIYLKGEFGIRIEDDVLVKKDDCEILTKSPKELIELY